MSVSKISFAGQDTIASHPPSSSGDEGGSGAGSGPGGVGGVGGVGGTGGMGPSSGQSFPENPPIMAVRPCNVPIGR